MALIAVAADKGAPGVTTACVALAAVWPRPVLLAECDPAGGDLVYWLPSAAGGRLDPGCGLLSLAVALRRGVPPEQVFQHAQKLRGGLDVLAGVVTAEQGAGLEPLWGAVGRLLAALPAADVIADCGRIGADAPRYDLLAQAAQVVLVTGDSLAEVVRLRERVAAARAAFAHRGRSVWIGVVVVADHRRFHPALAEVARALGQQPGAVGVVGGLAHEPGSAERLRGRPGGRLSGSLDRSLLIRTARDLAGRLTAHLPEGQAPAPAGPLLAAPASALPGTALAASGRPAPALPSSALPTSARPAPARRR